MSVKPIKVLLALLVFAMGCSGHAPAPSPAADPLSSLINVVAIDRSRLDSVIAQIHALSGDARPASLARFDQLRSRADILDTQYRADLVNLMTGVSARTSGVAQNAPKFYVDKTPDPFVRAFADGANWMLQSPLIFQVGSIRTNIVIVPRGFITDFASVPPQLKVIREMMPSASQYGIPSVVHDYLYWRQDCTREQADDIMKVALEKAGISILERGIVREGLQILGKSAWESNARARQSGLVRTVGPPHDQIPLTATWPQYRSWLNSIGAKSGVEYPVPQSVCRSAGTQ